MYTDYEKATFQIIFTGHFVNFMYIQIYMLSIVVDKQIKS